MSVDTAEVGLNQFQIKSLLRGDPEFFIQFFLGDALTHAVPDFHCDVFSAMVDTAIKRVAVAIPRGHAKTTLAKLAAVWHFLFSDYRFILYVSGSHDLVVPYVNDIANFFDTENFVAVFGEVIWKKRSDGEGIYKFIIPSLGNKICILRGLGSGQRTRGINVDNERPQLAICDDLEDDPDVESEAMHNKMLNWWLGPFYKCLNKFHNKIILSGNLLSTQSVFYKELQDPDWHSFLYAVIKTDRTPLWPDMWPMEDIIKDYNKYMRLGKIAKWFAEMMNHPVPEGGNIVDIEKIAYAPMRDPMEVGYGMITIDPALSQQDWANKCAIAAHGWIECEVQWQTLELYMKKGMKVSTIFNKATQMADRWGFTSIGVEAGALQGGLLQTFELLQLVNNLPQYAFVPVAHGNRHKTERIASWAGLLEQDKDKHALWALTIGEFIVTNQLINYDPAKKENDDDALDVCAQGLQMKDQYLMQIMQRLPQSGQAKLASLYDIAEC